MTLELGVVKFGGDPDAKCVPHVRDKEDVPHEHAIPDLYGVSRGFTLSEFQAAMEAGLLLRKELLRLIDECTEMQCTEDDEEFGLLVIRTIAHSKRRPMDAVEYVDVILSDLAEEAGQEWAAVLGRFLTHELMIEVERASVNRPHPQLEGSNSFKIFRYAKAALV